MMRPPVSLVRVKLLPGEDQVLQFPKGSGDDPGSARPERIDALDHGVSVSPVGRQPAGELRLGAISPPAGARGGDRCCSVPFVAR